MKVSNEAPNSVHGLQTGKTTGTNKKGKVEKNPKDVALGAEARQSSAKVELSDRAQEMKKIKELATKAPDVDAEKVKRFQELIDKGQYKVDSKKVADKMVDEHLLHAAANGDD